LPEKRRPKKKKMKSTRIFISRSRRSSYVSALEKMHNRRNCKMVHTGKMLKVELKLKRKSPLKLQRG